MSWNILPKNVLQYFLEKIKSKFMLILNHDILGAKNILPFPYAYGTGTHHGLTITVNDDGSITAQGVPTQALTFLISNNIIEDLALWQGSEMIFSEWEVENQNAFAALLLGQSTPISEVRGDYKLTVTSEMIQQGVAFILYFADGVDLTTPITFKPMVRLATDPDHTWRSPALTNKQLTDRVFYLNYAKSHVSANPSTTTGTLTGIEIDGTGYTFPGSSSVTGVKGSNESNYRTGDVNISANNVGALGVVGNVTVSSLDDLVALCLNSGNNKAFEGPINISTDIGVGITGWCNTIGACLNAPNNGSSNIGLFCLFMSTNTSVSPRYAIINGKTTGNYSVTATGVFTRNTDLATVATSGSYSDLSNTPTNVSSFTNDSGYLNSSTLGSAVQGLTIASFSGAGSSAAYCLLCEIKVTGTYINGASEITLCERGRTLCSRISWRFQSVNNTDPNVDSFKVLGDYRDIWIYKSTTSTWQIYVKKNENWSSIIVKDCYLYGGYTLTWKLENVALPSGATQATYALDTIYNKVGISAGTNTSVQVVGSGSDLAYTINATDEKVAQTSSASNNADYRVLYSGTADDTNRIEGARKGAIYFNPSSRRLFFANGYGFYGNVSKALTFQDGSDSNHAFCHAAYGGDANQWGVFPNKDGWLYLGNAYRRWGQIYSTNSAISTSDRNEKKDIVPLDENAKDFIMSLNPVSYKFKDGESGRTHYGMIAQDVEEEMTKLGMTTMDFAGLIKYPKKKQIFETINGAGQFKDIPIDGEYSYGLRYEEFMAPAIKTIQMLQEEVDLLKQRIDILEGK